MGSSPSSGGVRRRNTVAHLTSVHSPEDTRIFVKECVSLAEAGYDVVLVAPGGQDRTVRGVRIRSVARESSRLRRMIRSTWAVYRVARSERAALYHFHDPELIPVGLLLKAQGARVVYDAHEDLPNQIGGKHWVPLRWRPVLSRLADTVETVASTRLDKVVAATPGIAARFPPNKTVLLRNFPLPDELTPPGPESPRKRKPIVAYIGAISENRGAREMVQAAEALSSEAGIVLAGAFHPPQLEAELRRQPGWAKVTYKGWQSREGIRSILAEASVGLVVLRPTDSYVNALPVKLFEYMAAGLPVVASDFPLWREIVRPADCGLLVDPLDPTAIAAAIRYLLEHPEEAAAMGARGRTAVERQYDWRAERGTLLSAYRSLLA